MKEMVTANTFTRQSVTLKAALALASKLYRPGKISCTARVLITMLNTFVSLFFLFNRNYNNG